MNFPPLIRIFSVSVDSCIFCKQGHGDSLRENPGKLVRRFPREIGVCVSVEAVRSVARVADEFWNGPCNSVLSGSFHDRLHWRSRRHCELRSPTGWVF
ncbi:hypothetical protein X942_5906 [Burkholderia pseudomallei MSHR5596]|nr:hypothetical protein X942_5906 [Burkholderia pseudomallei MSHR5596]